MNEEPPCHAQFLWALVLGLGSLKRLQFEPTSMLLHPERPGEVTPEEAHLGEASAALDQL